MAELRFIMVNDSNISRTIEVRLKVGLAPHASPMMREPKLGKRNSARDMIASCLMIFDIVSSTLEKVGPSFNYSGLMDELCDVILRIGFAG